MLIYTGVALLLEQTSQKCLKPLVFYSLFNYSSNIMPTLLEQLNEVTGAFVMVINVSYGERQYVDVLKITSRS